MKSKTKIICPPLWYFVALILLVVLIGGLYYRSEATLSSRRANAGAAEQYRAQMAQISQMAMLHSDEKAAEAEAAAKHFREALMTSDQASTALNKAGAGWQVAALAQESNPDFNRTTYTLSHGSGPVSDWDGFAAFFKQLQAMPGVVVDSLDITASGDSQRRFFDRITLRLSIYLKKPAGGVTAMGQ